MIRLHAKCSAGRCSTEDWQNPAELITLSTKQSILGGWFLSYGQTCHHQPPSRWLAVLCQDPIPPIFKCVCILTWYIVYYIYPYLYYISLSIYLITYLSMPYPQISEELMQNSGAAPPEAWQTARPKRAPRRCPSHRHWWRSWNLLEMMADPEISWKTNSTDGRNQVNW